MPVLHDESDLELSFCYALQQDMRFSCTSRPNDAVTLHSQHTPSSHLLNSFAYTTQLTGNIFL